jgi:DHA3 family macrolide efflux protein-like MFS transporter
MNPQPRLAYGMRTFAVIWFGQLISTFGSGLSGFALGVWIYEETGSATLFAVSLFVFFLPTVVFAPFAGVIADRYDRRLVMLLSDSMAALATLFIFVMWGTDNLAVWHIYIANVVFSVANTLQWPAYSAATSLLVPKEHLGRAGGMVQVGDAISSLAAPAIAGTLYVTVGLRAILAIDVVTYLFALGTLVAVRFPQPEKTEEAQAGAGSFLQEAFFGWRYIMERPGLLGLQIILACANFALSTSHALITPMLLELTEPDVMGYIDSIGSAGYLLGTVVMSVWGGPKKRRIFGTYAFETSNALLLMVMGLIPSIPVIAASRFCLAATNSLANGCTQPIWQSKVAQDVQGRVFSARRMLSFSIIPIAYLVAGPLSEGVFQPAMSEGGWLASRIGHVIGVGPSHAMGLQIALGGLLYATATSFILILPRVRRMEIELPDAIGDEGKTEAA